MKRGLGMVLGMMLVLGLVAGCASTPKGPSDLEIIKSNMDASAAAAMAKDLKKVMTFYSEQFYSGEIGDKAAMLDFMENAKAAGYIDELTIDTKDAKITIEGKKATVTPIHVNGTFGSAEATFYAAKEDAGWKIVGMDVDGI